MRNDAIWYIMENDKLELVISLWYEYFSACKPGRTMTWMYLILGSAAGSGGSLSSLCSVYTAWTVCGSSTVLILLHNALSKLRSCQPTKELQAIKCRRMRIITSLLYSGESLVPRSCLPSTFSAPRLVESIKKMICSAHRQKNHSHESLEKCLWPSWANTVMQKLTCNLTTDPDTKLCFFEGDLCFIPFTRWKKEWII